MTTGDLHPTRTRLALLACAASGEVDGQASQWWLDGFRVTAAVQEQQRAGWLTAGDPPAAARATVEPTPAGRAVLTAAGRCGGCGRRFDDLDPEPLLRVCVHTTPARQVVCLDGCLTWELCGDCTPGGAR